MLITLLISSSSYDNYKLVKNSKLIQLLLSLTSSSIRTISSTDNIIRTKLEQGGRIIKNVYKEYLPAHIWQRISSQLKIDSKTYSLTLETMELGFFTAKFALLLISGIAILLIAIFDITLAYLFLLLPLTPLLQDLYLLSRYSLRSSQENMRFPQWLNLLSILLSSGLSLQRAIQICCRSGTTNVEHEDKRDTDYFEAELKQLRVQLENGVSPAIMISELSGRCTIFQIKYVLDLIVRYERDGGNEVLGIIALGAASSWQIYRDELKKKLQTKNLLYLLPCGLSLIAVIATALIPAAAMLMIQN